MTEHAIQSRAVGLLRARGVRFFAVPNGGLRDGATSAKLWREGVQAGVPDLIIVDRPPALPDKVGAALEIKTDTGRLSPDQSVWLQDLEARGWFARMAKGNDGLLRILAGLGYLPFSDVAPWLRQSADDSDVLGQPAVRLLATAAAPSRSTGHKRTKPSQGTGGAG